jgi:DNA polymerase/3'-5' exonuclease PolX
MHAVIHHTINDSPKWEQATQRIMSMIEQQRLPKGLLPLEYLPSVDGRKAVCVWEANSLSALKEFVDRETSAAARNDYFEVKVENAIGLPKAEEPQLAKAT